VNSDQWTVIRGQGAGGSKWPVRGNEYIYSLRWKKDRAFWVNVVKLCKRTFERARTVLF
jgi:hypothetical protein